MITTLIFTVAFFIATYLILKHTQPADNNPNQRRALSVFGERCSICKKRVWDGFDAHDDFYCSECYVGRRK